MVSRLGLSVSGMQVARLQGTPGIHGRAVAAVRRAVELGVDVIEVPLPSGPCADVVREALRVDSAVREAFIVAHLTAAVPDLSSVRLRLGGRTPDLLLADDHLLDDMAGWPLRLGAVVGPHSPQPVFRPLAALRGPYPARRRLVEWCERFEIPYLAPSPAILAAGRMTIALATPPGLREVEDQLGPGLPTPPAVGPG